jgi:exopolysaccharide biosynthesis polyprenyl glycosylphosphotransferase
MHKKSDLYFKLILIFLDVLALVGAFTVAYILRITLDPRPFYIRIGALEFISSIFMLLPIWIILFYFFRLYDRDIYSHPFRESGRLLLASICGIMLMISYGFFTEIILFPTKLVALYAAIASFIILLILRALANIIRLRLFKRGIGVRSVVLVGNSAITQSLAKSITTDPTTGFKLVAIVARKEFIPEHMKHLQYSSLSTTLRQEKIDAIIQTDVDTDGQNYELAEKHYLNFYQAPTLNGLWTARHEVELVDSTPLIFIKPTPLSGYGQVIKRIMDIVGSSIGIVLASPLMLLVAIAVKVDDPAGPILMRGKQQKRLTRYNQPFKVYKFRSHYAKFDGKTDEEVFTMIGKPELIEEYRRNGDKLDHDFRITRVGHFIRRFSLDELPQLFNVLKGDISLVGPRALVPHELNQYDKKSVLLSVKSGLTGLAVVSGRRDINFDERRQLDLYYVQNWSIWLDITILFKTIVVVFRG